jgi:hypothetical protein
MKNSNLLSLMIVVGEADTSPTTTLCVSVPLWQKSPNCKLPFKVYSVNTDIYHSLFEPIGLRFEILDLILNPNPK